MPEISQRIAKVLNFRRSRPPLQDGNPNGLHIGQNFHQSRNVSVEGDMNCVNYIVNGPGSNQFMEKLLEKTIQGAAADSSDRDPPPKCHPGTRLAILERCLQFIADRDGTRKMLWVMGAAGVGKSAIMQNVAESSLPSVSLRASIFLSIDGRNDGNKLILTLVYQLAAQCETYRRFIEPGVTNHPALLQSSMSVQFKQFIIEPFIHQALSAVGCALIIIDGLDECDNLRSQRKLLELISDACSAYPLLPIVWMIASRPEPHITSFFSQHLVKAVYEMEEIEVDTDEARSDVEKYLRDKLGSMQHEFSLDPQYSWPPEQDLWKLTSASGGLFIYAWMVVKYIGDPMYRNPTSQLNDVLMVIDDLPLHNVPREQHPMAVLDALYTRILSKVQARTLAATRNILLALVLESKREWALGNFVVLCNWLGMTYDDSCAAICHLHSVLYVPPRAEAHQKALRSFHKSFIDYLSDSSRSGFFSDIEDEAYQLKVQCTARVLEQALDGIDFGRMNYTATSIGTLACGPGTGADISLTWSVDEEPGWNDNRTRLEMYKLAISSVVQGIRKEESVFCTEFCIHLLTTRFKSYYARDFPFHAFQNVVFEKSRRREFVTNGILKEIPIKALNSSNNIWDIRLWFRRPATTNQCTPWNPSCKHNRTGSWGEGQDEDWMTEFMVNSSFTCDFCSQRMKETLANFKIQFPDYLVTILFTSTVVSFVEFECVDLDDGVSEWTYWFLYEVSGDERKSLGSTV